MSHAATKKRDRIISVLRREFPDLTWRYEWPSKWVSSAGWHVQVYAKLNMSGRDDDYTTEYVRSDTNEQMFGLEYGKLLK